MSDQEMTRRELARFMGMAGVVGAGWLVGVRSVHAQPLGGKPQSSQPTKPQTKPGTDPKKTTPAAAATPKSFLDDVLKKGRTRDWTLKVALHLQSYQTPPGQVQPKSMPTIIPFKFTTAALLFPVLASTAASETDVADVVSTLRFDNRDLGIKPQYADNYPCGTRFGRWEMRDMAGREIDLDIDIPMTCWETLFDDAKASKATWPAGNKWPRVPQSTFAPQDGVLAGPAVTEAVNQWCEVSAGKTPQSIDPVRLAKFLAGKVMEALQINGDGLVSSRTGLLQGFDLKGSEQTLKDLKGSEHDIACTLCAVYRAAGLPARTVIGLDVTKSKGQDAGAGLGTARGANDKLRSWVEFCLYDESAGKELWVPVDIVRQRRSGNRAPAVDKPWKYFGNNDDLDDVMPIAFQYHPPTTVIAHGSPCFWGWLTTPETQVAEQTLRFNSIMTPRRPDDKPKSPYK